VGGLDAHQAIYPIHYKYFSSSSYSYYYPYYCYCYSYYYFYYHHHPNHNYNLSFFFPPLPLLLLQETDAWKRAYDNRSIMGEYVNFVDEVLSHHLELVLKARQQLLRFKQVREDVYPARGRAVG